MRALRPGFRNPIQRSGDRVGAGGDLGSIQFFEYDPGPDWVLCDGRSLAPDNDNRKVLSADSASFSASGLGTFNSPGTPNIRGATLGENFVLPLASYGIWRSGNRGVSFQQTLVAGSGVTLYDSAVFAGQFVVAAGSAGIRLSADGGASWINPGPITVAGDTMVPIRLKVVGGALYAVSTGSANAIFRTTDLVTWTRFVVTGISFQNDGFLMDFDFANGEYVGFSQNGPAFFRSTDLTNWTLVTRLSENVPSYIAFVNGLWIAWGPFGSYVRGANGAFAKRANAMTTVFWNGVEFVGAGGAAGTVRVSSDFEIFVDKAVAGFTNNSPVYGVYQYDDGQMIVAQTSSTNTVSVSTTRAVRAPRPPQVRPTAVRGKPYVRVR